MGAKLVVGVNDLASQRPDIAAQWHPIMNRDLTSNRVCVSAGITVWFIHLDEDTNKFTIGLQGLGIEQEKTEQINVLSVMDYR